MYKCNVCDTEFDLTEEQYKEIGTCIKKDVPVEVEIKCPNGCVEFIVGGEPDWDEIDSKPVISLYSREK